MNRVGPWSFRAALSPKLDRAFQLFTPCLFVLLGFWRLLDGYGMEPACLALWIRWLCVAVGLVFGFVGLGFASWVSSFLVSE